MNTQTLDAAVAEARRFIERAEALQACDPRGTNPKESGATKRASLDLSRALADMRRPG